MARRVVQAQGREYLFSPDDPAPLSSRIWAIVQARLINDVTNEPVTSSVQLKSDIKECIPRISRDGLVGFVGIPSRVFSALAGRNFLMTVDINADGYLPRTLTASIPNDQRITTAPFPLQGDRVFTLNDTSRLLTGEALMVGGIGTNFEEVRIGLVGPAPNQVTTTAPFVEDHNLGSEPVVPVVPDNFTPVNLGDIRLVPSP